MSMLEEIENLFIFASSDIWIIFGFGILLFHPYVYHQINKILSMFFIFILYNGLFYLCKRTDIVTILWNYRLDQVMPNIVSKIHFTPSRSMPDLSNINFMSLLKANYLRFKLKIVSPITYYCQRIKEVMVVLIIVIKTIMKEEKEKKHQGGYLKSYDLRFT